MAGSALNLSLLARGIGEVKKNGHEKVNVVFEPEDYFNWAEDPRRIYLPPIQPKRAFETPRSTGSLSQRELHEIYLPKTFCTRKGALLLFSEDMADKTREMEINRPYRGRLSQSMDDLNLRTVDDLARSILAYGATQNTEGPVNLKFVYDRHNPLTPRKFRPGYSAKRYLSRLTRSFDDTIVDKLTTKGYVSEKSLYQSNALIPHIKRRINDDLSSQPPPYRIMKQMLMAPGSLSGFNFYRARPDTAFSVLSSVAEEDEEALIRPRTAGSIHIIDLRGGIPRQVSYSELSHEEKENVLSDLLVKSAINHALDKQREIIEGSLSRLEQAGEIEGDMQMVAHPGGSIQHTTPEFNMAEAVQSYIDNQVDIQSIPAAEKKGPGSLKGQKVSSHSAKSFSAHSRPSWPDVADKEKEYIGNIPVVSVKDTMSSTSSTRSSTKDPAEKLPEPVLSPIKDADERYLSTRGTALNPTPVLPPIGHQEGVPLVQIEPPTPQHSILTQVGTPKMGVSREATLAQTKDSRVEEDIEEEATEEWGGTKIDEGELLKHGPDVAAAKQKEELEQKRQQEMQKKLSAQSLLSVDGHGGKGPVLAGGSHLASSSESLEESQASKGSFGGAMKGWRGGISPAAARSGSGRSRGSVKKESDDRSQRSSKIGSQKGSVIIGPDGEAVSIGGSLRHKGSQEDLQVVDAVSAANKAEDAEDLASEQGSEWAGAKDDEEAQPDQWAQRSIDQRSVDGKPSSQTGYGKVRASDGAMQLTEQDLVNVLTEHAHKIASKVLSRPDTGEDLVIDAQAAAILWEEKFPANPISRSQSLSELARVDAAVAEFLQNRETAQSAEPTMKEYKELLKETLVSVVSRHSATPDALQEGAEVSPELIEALASQALEPDDIEIVTDEETGKSVIRAKSGVSLKSGKSVLSQTTGVKEGHIYREPSKTKAGTEGSSSERSDTPQSKGIPGPSKSIPSERASHTDLGFDVINYGEAEKQSEERSIHEVIPNDRGSVRKRAGTRSIAGKSQVSFKEAAERMEYDVASPEPPAEPEEEEEEETEADRFKQALESLEQEKKPEPPKSVSPTKSVRSVVSQKSKLSDKSDKSEKSEKSKGSKKSKASEKKEEFVVGKVADNKELEKLYGPVELPPPKVPDPPAKPKKEKPPPAPKKEKKGKKKKGKKEKDEGTPAPSVTESKPEEPAPAPVVEEKPKDPTPPPPPPEQAPSPVPSKTPSPAPSEEMDFIIIRDVSPEPEPEIKSVRSAKSLAPSVISGESVTESESDTSSQLNKISNKAARAAKRAAQAEKRRQEVERKRREREEQVRREREEAERKEKMQRDLEEDRRRREEEKRMQRLREEEERRREEEEEARAEKRARMEAEREKRQKEEYARKLEEMKKKQAEEEQRRLEEMLQKQEEEEARRREEELMLFAMAEKERIEYERKKAEEEERRKIAEEEERLRREEEARIAMEEARRLAEEMARKQAELEARLQFNRGLQQESSGMTHSQGMTRAFVFSYFELLQWLGIELPQFENLKRDLY